MSAVPPQSAEVEPRSLEDRVRAWESEYLWQLATPSYPAVRREPEPDSPMRTPFQRDRDRVVHSKAFRRLKYKTQVFIAPEGDHYRTRLTHTIETSGIARTVARALGLNEDLAEAIGRATTWGTRRSVTSARRPSTPRFASTRGEAFATTGSRCGWWTCWSATDAG